jgi:hypothetical protein
VKTELNLQHDPAGWRNVPASSKPIDRAKVEKLLASEWERFEATTGGSGGHNARAKKALPVRCDIKLPALGPISHLHRLR